MHGTLPVLGFRIGAFAYLTDCNPIPDVSWPLVEGLDVLVLAALRYKAHRTHFAVEQAVGVARRVGARRAQFTRMTHDLPHAAICDALPAGILLACDGLELDVAPTPTEHLLAPGCAASGCTDRTVSTARLHAGRASPGSCRRAGSDACVRRSRPAECPGRERFRDVRFPDVARLEQ